MEYVQRTIAAYDQSPQKFVDSTKEMSPIMEIERFTKSLPAGGSVLDAGCAYGRDTKLFANIGFKITGIDLSQELLKRAKEFSPQTKFLKMDIRNLDFPNNHFDGIWCHATLLHLNNEDLEKALREFNRVLKEEGVLFASFKEGKGSEDKVESFSSDYPRFFNYQTAESVGSLVKEAGFKSSEVFVINEREKFGNNKRDLNWVYAFAKK
jgi:SAM-dependent methyltransferase